MRNNSRYSKILKDKLREKGWRHKSGMYSSCFESSRALRVVENPSVSIIVISWRLHRDNLTSFRILAGQRDQNFELIFVDNGGRRGEFAVLKPFIDTYVRLRTNTGAYLARNIGALFAHAPLLLFLEDDGIPGKNLVKAHLDLFKKYDIIACRGLYVPKSDNPLNKRQSHYYMGDNEYPTFAHVEGNTSYLAQPFFAVGGWDDEISFGGGGAELYFRLLEVEPDRRKQIYSPRPVIYHDFVKDEKHLADKLEKQRISHDRLRRKYPRWDEIHTNARLHSERSDLVVRNLKKVLLVNHALPPWENTGTPITTLNHARGLMERGIQVGVLMPSQGEVPAGFKKESRDGITIYQVPAFDRHHAFLGVLDKTSLKFYLAAVAWIVREFSPDIVHVNDYLDMPSEIIALFHDLGCPVVRNVCNDEEICHQNYPVTGTGLTGELCSGPVSAARCAECFMTHVRGVRPQLLRTGEKKKLAALLARRMISIKALYGKNVDAVVFTSRPFKKHFTSFVPIDEEKICIIPRGFKLPCREKTNQDRGAVADEVRFAFFGSLIFSKGIDVLLRAFEHMAARYRFRLDIYGSSGHPEFQAWQNKLSEEFPNRIFFHGEYQPEQFADLAAQADIAIVPSYFDTYNRVVRECLHYGIPVIATDFFGAFIIRSGFNGLRIPIGDDRALARAMIRVIDKPALLKTLQAGARTTEIPTLEDEINALIDLYETLLFARRMERSAIRSVKKDRRPRPASRDSWIQEGNRYLRDIDRLLLSILANSADLPVFCLSTLFINTGAGFNEHDTVHERIIGSHGGSFQVSFDLHGFHIIQGVRFDPWEGAWGRLKLEEISVRRPSGQTDRIALSGVQAINGDLGLDGFYTFKAGDPVIEIHGISDRCLSMTLRGRMELFDSYRIEEAWAGEKEALAAEKNALISEREELQKQIAQTNQEVKHLDQILAVAKSVRSWHQGEAAHPVVLFGTGALAEWVLQLLDHHRFPIGCCFDNRPRSPFFQGLPVQKPAFIPGIKVIIASMYETEIRQQLRDLGYKDEDLLSLHSGGPRE